MSLWGLLYTLGLSLALTLALELAFAAVTGRRSGGDMLAVVAVNVATNPPVVLTYLLLRQAFGRHWPVLVLLLEGGAIAVEYLLYRRHGGSFKRPLLFAVTSNIFSYGLGALLQMLW